MKTEKSTVLSVSVGKGCYRHIKVSMDETLEDLADIILDAFDFDNDHAHAFFMDNKVWSEEDCYYVASVDIYEEYRHTCDYKLYQLKLQKNDKFKFVFDFGDEWRFQCSVLRFIDEETVVPTIVRAVGEPPEQYSYEGFFFDDDDEDI